VTRSLGGRGRAEARELAAQPTPAPTRPSLWLNEPRQRNGKGAQSGAVVMPMLFPQCDAVDRSSIQTESDAFTTCVAVVAFATDMARDAG